MLKEDELEQGASLGVFTAVALVLLFWALCWLKTYTPFSPQQHIKVIFPEIAGLDENADVYVDGVRAGTVGKINWLDNEKVLVSLRINKTKIQVRQGARFDILTNGIVGAKYVDITLPQSTDAPLLDDSLAVVGEKPVRTEIAISKLAGEVQKLDMDNLGKKIENDRKIFRQAASKFVVLADKTMPVMDRALPLENNLRTLSAHLSQTSIKLNKLLDADDVSPEIKETVRQAKETAHEARLAIHELNTTLSDKDMRQDLVNTMDKFSKAANQIEMSMEVLKGLSNDTELRADTKQMLLNARIAMEKLDEVFSEPTFGSDLKSTMQKTRAAVQDIDTAAQQLQQILNKRHPLLHMIFGRPGYIRLNNTEIHAPLPDSNLEK